MQFLEIREFAGIILGLTGTVAVFPGFISPYIVGRLTLNNVSREINSFPCIAILIIYFSATANGSAMAIRISYLDRLYGLVRSSLCNIRTG